VPGLRGDGVTDDSWRQDWQCRQRWRQQVERRLNEAMALAKGIGPAHADRISDVIEMVEELRRDLDAEKEKREAMGKWIKENVVRKERTE
jgi:hypothetical protein